MNRTLVATVFSLAVLSSPSPADAASWCAVPLHTHEWGVHVISAGAPGPAPPMPARFHSSPPPLGAAQPPVRELPPDSGERALPIVHFYTSSPFGQSVPVAVEVGFTQGEATLWFPQVDRHRTLAETRTPAAVQGRLDLEAARAVRQPYGAPNPPLSEDPTRALTWNHILLTAAPATTPPPPGVAWVDDLRQLDRALWVNDNGESERFLFYEGETREQPLVAFTRSPRWTAAKPHYTLKNTSTFAVHDVVVIHRDGGQVATFHAPQIPAGAQVEFALAPPIPTGDFAKQARERLRLALTDATTPTPPEEYDWTQGECVMSRDPAIPVEAAEGHRLFAAEVEALLDVWGPRFFEQTGTTVVYREDTAYLDAVMPLSVYTDMYHFVSLRRAGLVVWEGLTLP